MSTTNTTLSFARAALAVFALTATFAFGGEPRFEGAIFSNDKRSDVNMETFPPDTKKIYLTVHVEDVPNDAKLKATWFVENAGAFKNTLIASSDVTMRPQMKTATYSLDKPGIGWPPGDYKVELAIDNKVQSTVRFKVSK